MFLLINARAELALLQIHSICLLKVSLLSNVSPKYLDTPQSANQQDDARADIHARRFGGGGKVPFLI